MKRTKYLVLESDLNMFVNTKINFSCLSAFTKSKGYRNIALLIFGLILPAFIPSVVVPETVIQKVARTGVLTSGISRDALPFAYTDNQGTVFLNRDLRDLAVETMQLMIEFHEEIPQKEL